jgi:hypothetical protein
MMKMCSYSLVLKNQVLRQTAVSSMMHDIQEVRSDIIMIPDVMGARGAFMTGNDQLIDHGSHGIAEKEESIGHFA